MNILYFAIAVSAIGPIAATEPRPDTSANSDMSVSVPAANLKFYQNKSGLTFANAWRDPANGPHSNFIRIDGRTSSPLHLHTASYYGVVISGTVSNEQTGKPDLPLGPGSYWYQRGKEPHVTKCLSEADCLIFVTSKGSFDFIPVIAIQTGTKRSGNPPR